MYTKSLSTPRAVSMPFFSRLIRLSFRLSCRIRIVTYRPSWVSTVYQICPQVTQFRCRLVMSFSSECLVFAT